MKKNILIVVLILIIIGLIFYIIYDKTNYHKSTEEAGSCPITNNNLQP